MRSHFEKRTKASQHLIVNDHDCKRQKEIKILRLTDFFCSKYIIKKIVYFSTQNVILAQINFKLLSS